MIGCGAQDIINDAQCGFVASPGDYIALARLIKENYKQKDLLKKFGDNARSYYKEYFTVTKGISHFERLISFN